MISNFEIYLVLAVLALFILIFFKERKLFFLFLLVCSITFSLDFHLVSRRPFTPGTVNGIAIRLTDISLVVLYFLWFLEIASSKKKAIGFFPNISIPALGLLVAGVLSIWNSAVPMLTIFMMIFLIKMFALYFYLGNNIKSEKQVEIITVAILITIVLQSALSFYEYFTHTTFDLAHLQFKWHEFDLGGFRPSGTFGGSDDLAAFMTIFLPMCLVLGNQAVGKCVKRLSITCFFMGLISLILTLSRGGWISFMLSMFFLGALGSHKLFKIRHVIFAITIISMVFVIFFSTIIFRFSDTGIGLESRLARIPLMKTALNMVRDHPVIGVGLNNYPKFMYHYIPPGLENRWVYIVHNRFLLIWAEVGTLGLFFFSWLWIAIIRTGLKPLDREKNLASVVTFCIAIGLMGHTFHMMVEIFSSPEIVSLKWFLAGFFASVGKIKVSDNTLRFQQSYKNLKIP